MKCLLCNFQNPNDEELKKHFIAYHFVDKDNYFFKELFSHNTKSRYSKNFDECKIKFRSCRQKKNHSFSVHRAQFGGAITSLPINVIWRSIITTHKCTKEKHNHLLFYQFFAT